MKLKDHVRHQRELDALRDRLNEVQFEAIKQAVVKQERATDIRLESMNEFRDTLTDQAKELVTTQVFNTQVKSINDKVDLLQNAGAVGQGAGAQKEKNTSELKWMVATIVSIAIAAIALASHFTFTK